MKTYFSNVTHINGCKQQNILNGIYTLVVAFKLANMKDILKCCFLPGICSKCFILCFVALWNYMEFTFLESNKEACNGQLCVVVFQALYIRYYKIKTSEG